MMRPQILPGRFSGLLFAVGAVAVVATACADDEPASGGDAGGQAGSTAAAGKGGKGGGSGGSAGSVGNAGSAGKGGGGGKAGGASGGDAGAEGGGEAGASSGGTGGTGGSAGTAGAGSAGKGGGGSGSAELDALCGAFAKLKKDKRQELGCSSDDSEAIARMCAISGSCFTELDAHYDCEKAASTWSCDTGDGHPQTNGACNETSGTFFACLGPAVHEEDPFGCAAIAATNHEIAMALDCNIDETIENTCNQLYLRDLCVEPWEALTSCTASATESDFECDMDGNLMPTVCSDERSGFDDCLESLR